MVDNMQAHLYSEIRVTPTNLHQCDFWQFTPTELRHRSGRYFSVQLIAVHETEHVYIHQPEVGILAFVVSELCDESYWLLQIKPEPGNVGFIQYAPTVQATKSNYERVHGGARTPFLELFTSDTKGMIVDVEGSEQGDRFLNKFNRNMKRVGANELSPLEQHEGFEWVDRERLKLLLSSDYVLNTDARSVIA